MTVKLLIDWKDSRDGKQYIAGNLLTTDAGTESGLVAANLADTNLTGGTAYVAPVEQTQYEPVMASRNLTGGISFAGRINAEIIKGKIGRVPLRVSGIGNSIMYSPNPWFVHACDQSGGLFVAIDSGHGVPGNNTSQMLARAAEVPVSADIVVIMEDTNSAAAISNLLHAQNMRGLIEFYLDRGQLPIVCRGPVCADNVYGHDWNRVFKYSLISYFVAHEYDVPCLDPWRIFVDESTGKLSATAGATDGVHPGGAAHYAAGAEMLKQLLGTSHAVALPVAQTTYAGAGLLSNPLMMTAMGSYGSGGTLSTVADAAIPGSWQRITGNGTGQMVAFQNTGAIQGGDVLFRACRYKIASGGAGNAAVALYSEPSIIGLPVRNCYGDSEGILYGYSSPVPDVGVTYLQDNIYTNGCSDGRYVQIAQSQIYNVTALLERSF